MTSPETILPETILPETILKEVFGFDSFRSGQKDIIDKILSGQNILAVMPTGAGKSLCYQVPALVHDGLSVIISPLVALMDNQVAGLRASGVSVACIHSGQSRDENISEWRRIAAREAKLLYLSPERLMSARMMAAMRALDPSMFVIDEAHCVSKWGPSFRPEYDQLQELKTVFPNAVVAAFTATADAPTRTDIADKLFSGDGDIFVQGFDRPNLSLAITPRQNRDQQVLDFMENVRGQSGIIYCLSRKNTEHFAALLKDKGYNALPYHAGLASETRFANQERFMAEEAVIMVATIAFGMGIDKPDIRFVFHTNLPSSLEAYYQEIGRAGRDGADAVTALVYGLDDVRLRRQFIRNDGADDAHKVREEKRLEALLGYCEASGCRRKILLDYFGETSTACGNCDNCLSPPELIDATQPLSLILQALRETGQRFGQAHVIDVVRGADTDRIRQFGHERCKVYGQGKATAKPYFQALLRQAIASGHIDMNIEKYGALTLTAKGLAVLGGSTPFMCKAPTTSTSAQQKQTREGSSGRANEHTLSDNDKSLLAALKVRRMELAHTLGKPAFIVFSDATLIAMAKDRPETREQMLAVSGVGEKKFESFGADFLQVIRTD